MQVFTRNCGSYNYKSYIGEGPKYTISQKFSIDGKLEGKRHPRAHAIEPTPGPGSYDIKTDLGGPKYTIGLKRVSKSLSQYNLGPAVGTYNLRKDSSFITPCFKFDTEKRENLETNKSNINYPGPGKYNKIDILETKGIKWSFPLQGRFMRIKPRNSKLVRINVPGPGSYNIKSIFGKEGPKFTFNKDKYNHSDTADESMKEKMKKYPCPGSYLQRIDYITDQPKYSIPKFDLSKSKEQPATPGPTQYNPNMGFNSLFKKIPNYTISKARRDEDEIKNPKYVKLEVPGPGRYDIKNGEFPQGPSYTIQRTVQKLKIKDEPGPGNYNANDNHRNKEPSYSIGKSTREDDLKSVKKDDYPGPGAYKTKELNISPKYTIPKDNFNNRKTQELPGPGFYKIPTSFDNINDMTRSGGSFDPNFRYV